VTPSLIIVTDGIERSGQGDVRQSLSDAADKLAELRRRGLRVFVLLVGPDTSTPSPEAFESQGIRGVEFPTPSQLTGTSDRVFCLDEGRAECVTRPFVPSGRSRTEAVVQEIVDQLVG
jgi:hypothetical protein